MFGRNVNNPVEVILLSIDTTMFFWFIFNYQKYYSWDFVYIFKCLFAKLANFKRKSYHRTLLKRRLSPKLDISGFFLLFQDKGAMH